jgi:tetratricopeptide (TPR) repeat protein
VTEDAQALLRILLQGKMWRLEPFAGEIGLEEAAARATALLQRGEDLPLALWLFHRVKELAPDDPRGHAGVGACRLAGGRYGQALRELSRAAEIAPERADVRQLLGDVYLKLNRLDDALKAYRQAADLAPNVYEYPLKLGVALQLDGKYAEALAVLGTAAEKGAPAADVHVAMANVLRSSGNAERAAEEYRLALAAKPDSREARLGLSEVLVAQAAPSIVKRDFDAALKLLREAQDLSPSALGYARLALIFTETQRYEEAVRVTEEAERAGLGTAPVFHNRAFALARLGRRDEALKAYDAALQLQPESATTLLNKANLLTQMNRAPEARALLARVRADRINLETRVRIATVLARLEEYPAALAELDAVLKLDPKSVLALNAKAFVFNRIGRYDEAVAVLDDALRLDRANDGLYTNRAYALAELGRHEDAIAAADRALAINSQSAAALSHKGYSLYLLGKSEEGLELIREAAALDPAYGGSRYNLARVHVRQGRNEETLADLAAAFDLDPRFRTLALEAPEFAALRLDPGFRRLLARFQTPDSANPMTPASPESSNGPG